MIKNILSFDKNTNYIYNNFYITIIAAYVIAYSVFYFLLPEVLPFSLFVSAIVFSVIIGLAGFICAKIASRTFTYVYEIVENNNFGYRLQSLFTKIPFVGTASKVRFA